MAGRSNCQYPQQCDRLKKEIILIGGGGHCKACIDVIERGGDYRVAGIVDVPGKRNQKLLGYEIIASDSDLPEISKSYDNFLITVGHIESPQKRIELYDVLKKLGVNLPVIQSPLAYVSKSARVGNGSIIMHQALVNAAAIIGQNCIVNTKALIEHDVVIEDHCHVAT